MQVAQSDAGARRFRRTPLEGHALRHGRHRRVRYDAGPVRLALLASAPVYYHTPLYRRLAADPRLDFTAIFASTAGVRRSDVGFGKPVAWDVDLLNGYRNCFLRRADRNAIAGSSPFFLRDPDIVYRLVRKKYEVLWLHGYNSVTHALAAVAQKAIGGKLLFREEQTLLHRRALLKALTREVLLRSLYRQGAAMYIGTRNREWFSHLGVPPERLFSTPYTVDNDELQAAGRELAGRKEKLKQRFGLPPDAGPVILTVMRLVPKKQPLFLLEAFRRARERSRCCLLVVGSGPLEAEMRAAARNTPDVHFAGFLNRSEIPSAYACADVFALASRLHETWGLVVNEAMNFHLPILVSDKVGCAVDLVEHGGNGFVASASDVEDFAGRMKQLVEDAALRHRLGSASLARISAWHFDDTAQGAIEAVAATVGSARWSVAEEFARR